MDEKTEERIDEAVDKLTEVTTDLICGVGSILGNFFNKEKDDEPTGKEDEQSSSRS